MLTRQTGEKARHGRSSVGSKAATGWKRWALVKLLEEQGNLLRRPQSGALGAGLFELRGKEVRLF
jgi:hypothetical protein